MIKKSKKPEVMKKLHVLLFFIFCILSVSLSAQKRMTSFEPQKHGLNFVNTFHNNFVSQIDWRTGGLCGGMVYTALDYYHAKRSVPVQNYRPNDGTRLHTHIYKQQVESIVKNIGNWGELGLNPDGARNEEFFRWGMKERLRDIMFYVNRNQPMPMGLMGAGGPNNGGEHQVLIIGYDLGRYKVNLGAYQSDVKIYTYNPNYPNKISIIRPDVNKKVFYTYDSRGNRKEWRGYFVDRKYRRVNPPTVAGENYPNDGKIYELIVFCETGGDDLRGGNDNLDVTINFHGQSSQLVRNVNLGRRWINNYEQAVRIKLQKPIAEKYIKSVQLYKHAGGGINGDNWKLNKLTIKTRKGGGGSQIYKKTGLPLKEFRGNTKTFIATINANAPAGSFTRVVTTKPIFTSFPAKKVNYIEFEFRTGSDDLRGGNDNLNVKINFKNGRSKYVRNVNRSRRWTNNSRKIVRIKLDTPMSPGQVKNIQLSTTFKGGFGGDNWNMNGVKVLEDTGSKKSIFQKSGNPVKRFTSSSRTFTIYPK